MKYLMSFNEMVNSENPVLIYDIDLRQIMPDTLEVEHYGNHKFKLGNIMKNADMIQITYVNESSEWGYTDCLEFDIYMVNDVDKNKMRLDIDITLGDFVVSEFSIDAPNKIKVIEHMTYRSKFCRDCPIFALTDESVEKLASAISKIDGFQITPYDIRFLNNKDDYQTNDNKVSIFDDNWVKILPDELTICSSNGRYTLKLHTDNSNLGHKTNVAHLMNWITFSYWQNTAQDGDVTKDGEPDYLNFDISIVKNNDGTEEDSKNLKLLVDITYGDSMMYEFTLSLPDKVDVFHYDGYGSKYDPEYFWGFDDESVIKLVKMFNSFGYKFTPEHFKFLDKYLDSYQSEN